MENEFFFIQIISGDDYKLFLTQSFQDLAAFSVRMFSNHFSSDPHKVSWALCKAFRWEQLVQESFL